MSEQQPDQTLNSPQDHQKNDKKIKKIPPNSLAVAEEKPRDLVLSHQEAEAGSPESISVSGEEDPGVGLETLVRSDND